MGNRRHRSRLATRSAKGAMALLLLAVAALLVDDVRAAPLGSTAIRVLGLAVDLDTRPDLEGVQNTMTAVRDVPTGVETFVGSPVDPSVRHSLTGTLVKAELTGPSTNGQPRTVMGPANQLLALPLLRVAGTHRLTNVRLEDMEGNVLLQRDPSRPPLLVDVVDQLLVTNVTTRPLTLDEIQARGIVIDEDNFTALNFAVALTLGSEQVTIDLPVLIPTSQQALVSNKTPALISLQPDPEQIRRINIPNFSLSGFGMRAPPDLDGDEKNLIPNIHGVLVIPGNLAFLNQFFSVILQATNTAPEGSGLTVEATRATISLPLGEDAIEGSGDDPLRVAETQSGGVQTELPLRDVEGSDAIGPQRTNSAEFLVEGLREGTHPVRFDLRGDLYVPGLGRSVELTGVAAGVVQVRNPTFSIVLAHPKVVRDGEEYGIFATVTNTSTSPANLFRLELARRSLSGARFADGESELRELEQLLPGQTETFEYRLVARTTGEVTGTVFLAEPGINGSFRLTTGVGDRGIPLSPDTLVLPQTVDYLPREPDLVAAAVRVLGMAYSVATAPAGALPPDVARVSRAHVFDRAVKLAQVGLHMRFGESADHAVQDLLLDWLGNDRVRLAELLPDEADRAAAERDLRAFDELRRTTDAGHDFDGVVGDLLGTLLDGGSLALFQREMASRFASRPEILLFGAASIGSPVRFELRDAAGNRLGGLDPTTPPAAEIPYASRLPLSSGPDAGDELLLVASPEAELYTLDFSAPDGGGAVDLSFVARGAEGLAFVAFRRVVLQPGGRGRLRVTPGALDGVVIDLDADGNGVFEAQVEPLLVEPIADEPPALLGVEQWAKGASPQTSPSFELGDPIGRMVGVLFDEEVSPESAALAARYAVPENSAVSVALQPDRRLAFVVLQKPVGPFVPRTLTVSGVEDLRGQTMQASALPIQADPERGVGGNFQGRVVTASGEPIPFATVRYIQPLDQEALFECFPKDFHIASYQADAQGRFSIDFVLQNDLRDVCTPDIWLNDRNAPGTNNFKLDADDPRSGEQGRASTRVQFDGQGIRLDVVIRGFGSIGGLLLDEAGNVVTGGDPGSPESLQVLATNLSTGERLLSWVDADGRYAFPRTLVQPDGKEVTAESVPVGNVALLAARPADGATAVTTVNIPAAGAHVEQDLVLFPPFRFGAVSGVVLESDGRTPAPGVRVFLGGRRLTGLGLDGRSEGEGLLGSTVSDENGAFRFENVPAGSVQVVAQRQSTFEESEARGVVPEGGEATLQLVLPGSGGTVRGIVIDAFGNPVAGAQVAAGTTLTNAGADGRFEVRGLPRGNVTVFGQGSDSPALGKVAITTSGPDDLQEVVVTLEPIGSVVGSVFEADGETPVVAQKVQLWFGPDKGVMAETFTDLQGGFAFRNYPLGEYSLRAIRPSDMDGGSTLTTIRFAGDQRDADIVFRGLGQISGRVIQSNGTPAITDVIITRKVWRIIPDTGPIDNAALGLAILQEFAKIPGLSESVANAISENGLDAPANEFFFLLDESVALRSDILGENGEVTGRFLFEGDATGGPFTVAAFGPFLSPAEVQREIPRTRDPVEREVDVGDIVLEPATGAVRGTVYLPDGVTPVGADVLVKIRSLDNSGSVKSTVGTQQQPVLPEIDVLTDENGEYELPLVLRGSFVLTADTGAPPVDIRAGSAAEIQTELFSDTDGNRLLNVRLFGRASGAVPLLPFGEFVTADIRLRDVAGARVRVVEADGTTPVEGARVALVTESDLDQDPEPAFTDGNGEVDFFPLLEGPFSVAASLVGTPRRGSASALVPVNPPNGLELPVTLQLGAVTTASGQVVTASVFGSVEGTVFRADGTPLDNPSQVMLKARGAEFLATSGPDGRYRVENVPGGLFMVEAFEPFTARRGSASGSLATDGQTVEAPITLVGLGSVSGSVFRNDGSAATGGLDVTLSPSGRFSDRLVTRTDGTGAYQLPGVPLGPYTVRASDFQSGLAGSASGALARDGERRNTDVYLEASGGILGVVYAAGVTLDGAGQPVHADGSPFPEAPRAAGVTVEIRSGAAQMETVQTDANGSFESSRFLKVGEYALTAREPLADDGATGTAHVRFDGETAFASLALRGLGTISGVILDSLGQQPVEGASVTFASESPFSRGARSRVTDDEGRFSFVDVAVGAFSLSVRTNLQTPPLGAAAAGALSRHEELLAFADDDADPEHDAIRLQPAGNITGRVILADGDTPAEGAVALLLGGSARLSRVADATGSFVFEGIPLGSYSLSIREPVTNGVARRSLTLAVNGEEIALGDVGLDERPPMVLATEPAGFAGDVAPAAPIRIRFDEPIDEATLNPATLQVTVKGAVVAGARSLEDGGLSIVFTPTAPLPDLQSVDVRVAGDRFDFDGKLLAAGVQDLAGRGLVQDHLFSFTTGDTRPPVLVSVTPSAGALEVDPREVIRFEFDEPVDRTSIAGFALRTAGGTPVAGSLNSAPIQGDSVLVFTPSALLPLDTAFVATLSGPVRDRSGNAMAEATVGTTFSTLDTQAPALASLALPVGTAVVVGRTVVATAEVAAAEPGLRVEFSLGGAVLAVDDAAPFTQTLLLTPALGSQVTLRAVALDAVGNRSPPRDLVLAIGPNLPPIVTLLAPASGDVSQGQTVTVQVAAQDDVGLAELRFFVNDGAVAVGSKPASGEAAETSFSFTVPSSTPAGSTLRVRAAASDVLGLAAESAAEAALRVGDDTAPIVTVGSPAPGTRLQPGTSVNVVVRADDASGVTSLSLSAASLGFDETRNIDPATSPAQETFVLPVPAGAVAGNVTVTARATDLAGNVGVRPLALRVADGVAPTLELSVPGGDLEVDPGGQVTVDALARDNLGVVRVELSLLGQAPQVRSFNATPERTESFTLQIPAVLAPGATLTVEATAFDADGNAGAAEPLALTVVDRSPPSVEILAPSAGAVVEPGSQVAVQVRGEDASGVARFELELAGPILGTQSRDLTPAPGIAEASFQFDVPPDLEAGEEITIRVRAIDLTDLSAETSVVIRTPDRRGPRLVALAPAAGATGVGTVPLVVAGFDEPMDRATVTVQSFFLLDGAGAVVPATLGFEDEDRILTLSPQLPLVSGARYRVVLIDTLTDLAGNPARAADGSALGRLESAFDTGGARLVAPEAGARFVEGDTVDAVVLADADLAAQAAVIRADEAVVATAPADPDNLARPAGASYAASATNGSFEAALAFDGDLQTQWNTGIVSAAGAFVEVTLPAPVSIRGVDLFGIRQFQSDSLVIAGQVEIFAVDGTRLFDSGTVVLPEPSGDLFVETGILDGVARVRFTALSATGQGRGLAEMALRPIQHVLRASFPAPRAQAPGNAVEIAADLVLPLDLARQPGALHAASSAEGPFVAGRAFDGDISTSWAAGSPAPQFLEVTFAEPVVVGRVEVFGARDIDGNNYRATTGQVEYFAADGALLFTSAVQEIPGLDVVIDTQSVPGVTRVRFTGLSSVREDGLFAISELRVRPVLAVPGVVIEVQPADGDVDGDGLPNGDERRLGSDPFVADAHLDPDGDGLTTAEEAVLGTDPFDADTDGDLVNDGDEVTAGTDPLLGASLIAPTAGLVAIEGDSVEVAVSAAPKLSATAVVVRADGDVVATGQADLDNRARVEGAVYTASATNGSFAAALAFDGDLQTQWDSGSVSPASAFVEVTLPAPVSIRGVELFGVRRFQSGSLVTTGRVEVFAVDGTPLFDSGSVALPAPSGDLFVDTGVLDGVARVRFTGLAGTGTGRGLAEMALRPALQHLATSFAAPPGNAFDGKLEIRADLVLPDDLARNPGASYFASSTSAGFVVARVFDGDVSTSWLALAAPQFVEVTLPEPDAIGRVEIFGDRSFTSGDYQARTGRVEFFTADGTLIFDSGVLDLSTRDFVVDSGKVEAVARVRFTGLTSARSDGQFSISELRVRKVLPVPGVLIEVLPADGDEDGDGLLNGEERRLGSDPFVVDADLDPDVDGLTTREEAALGTDPFDADSDDDGLLDGAELLFGTDPLNPDTDGDGIPDGEDVLGGPRLLQVEPGDGATGVSVQPVLRLRFDEPVAPETATPERLQLLDAADQAIAYGLTFLDGDRTLELRPLGSLGFASPYRIALEGTVTGVDGAPVRDTGGAPIVLFTSAFTTGSFAIVAPGEGTGLLPGSAFTLRASGDAALGIARVAFEVDGEAVGEDDTAPYEIDLLAPETAGVSLELTAIALGAGDEELARNSVTVEVFPGLRFEGPILGVALGAGRMRIVTSVPPSVPVEVTLEAFDPSILSVPASVTFPAGATLLDVAVTGLVEGATAVLATTPQASFSTIAAVSEAVAPPILSEPAPPGETIPAVSRQLGVSVRPFPSVGQLVLRPGETRIVEPRLLDAPAQGLTPISILPGAGTAVTATALGSIPAGGTAAPIRLQAGAAGEAVFTIRAGGVGRELRVVVGTPAANRTTPVLASPVGTIVLSLPSAGDVILPEGTTRNFTVPLVATPSASPRSAVVSSSDPAVANITAPVTVPAGSTDAILVIETGAAGEALLTIRVGNEGRELRVVVGTPSPDRTPPVLAAPVGTLVLSLPSAGDVILQESATSTITVPLVATATASPRNGVVVSSDPAVATVTAQVVVPAGSTSASLVIETGVAGEALLTIRVGDEGRELRVIVGTPAANRTPPILAPPIGVTVLEAGSAGMLFLEPGGSRTLRVALQPFGSLADLPVAASSLDPGVATVSPALQTLAAGQREIEITVSSSGFEPAETRIDLRFGLERRTLRVIVGSPAAEAVPLTVAPPVGVEVESPGALP